MAQKLVITLDEETTENYLKLAKQRISAKLDADAACILESSAQFVILKLVKSR